MYTTNPYFGSIKMFTDHREGFGVCITTPVIPSCFLAFSVIPTVITIAWTKGSVIDADILH